MTSRTVVITGASTGIGRACALRLDNKGWTVFAGVRKEQDGVRLENDSSGHLRSVIVDVTDQESIAAAAKTVSEASNGRGLNALVNNAGITVQGPLEYLDLDELRRQFEVNVFGQIAMTQACLPELRVATGRIVFVSSIAGRAPSLPLIGPYGASKKALEGLAESLRGELLPWDLPVSLIEPGSIDTPIWEKGDATLEDLIDDLPEEGRRRYEDALRRGRRLAMSTGRRGIPPEKVAEVVERALSARRPRLRYLVGLDARARAFVEPVIPEFVRERAVRRMLGYEKSEG
ncbi:MAG: SDR family oxidoreductase [Actinomycetota bacterium]|nr:SDR family oxidoreductase [Actinomycetota bacterium]